MDPFRLLLRMSQIVRNPPSWRTVKVVLAVLALCGVLYGIERAGWWPESLTSDRARPPQVQTP